MFVQELDIHWISCETPSSGSEPTPIGAAVIAPRRLGIARCRARRSIADFHAGDPTRLGQAISGDPSAALTVSHHSRVASAKTKGGLSPVRQIVIGYASDHSTSGGAL